MAFISNLWFLKSRLYSKLSLFNVKFHFGHNILYRKSRLYVKSRFVNSRLYCTKQGKKFLFTSWNGIHEWPWGQLKDLFENQTIYLYYHTVVENLNRIRNYESGVFKINCLQVTSEVNMFQRYLKFTEFTFTFATIHVCSGPSASYSIASFQRMLIRAFTILLLIMSVPCNSPFFLSPSFISYLY